MTMLDVLKERLPEGLEIVKVRDRASASQAHILFSYDGTEAEMGLQKTCAPGMAEYNCDFTICAVMQHIFVTREDWTRAKEWMDKQSALNKQHII